MSEKYDPNAFPKKFLREDSVFILDWDAPTKNDEDSHNLCSLCEEKSPTKLEYCIKCSGYGLCDICGAENQWLAYTTKGNQFGFRPHWGCKCEFLTFDDMVTAVEDVLEDQMQKTGHWEDAEDVENETSHLSVDIGDGVFSFSTCSAYYSPGGCIEFDSISEPGSAAPVTNEFRAGLLAKHKSGRIGTIRWAHGGEVEINLERGGTLLANEDSFSLV